MFEFFISAVITILKNLRKNNFFNIYPEFPYLLFFLYSWQSNFPPALFPLSLKNFCRISYRITLLVTNSLVFLNLRMSPEAFFFLHLYWSIIALQCSVSFCCLTKWISYMYTYIPISPPSLASLPPSLSHPSKWSQSTEVISLCYAAASY